MTATSAPPRGGSGRGAPVALDGNRPDAQPRTVPVPIDPIPRHQRTAEVWLVVVSVALVIGFTRVFTGGSFLPPLLVVALATHGGLVLARRRDLGLATTAAATVVGFVILGAWLFFGHTTRFLLPTPTTWHALQDALSTAWTSFQDVAAPTAPQSGFLVSAAFGLCFAVFLADWAAFRLWAPVEALIPTLTLFLFTALVGSTQGRVVTTLLFTTAALLFVLTHRVAERERTTAWLANQADRGSSWLFRTGGLLIVVAVLVGGVLGPRLPGANDSGLLGWRGNKTGPSSRVTISPLVDIRSRLIDHADTVLFTVRSSQRAYWRMTSLDTFDGQIWRSTGRYKKVEGDLPGGLPSGVTATGQPNEVEQTFHISALSALWLPAAFEPVAIDANSTPVRFQPDSSTLIVDDSVSSSDEKTYTVRSVTPNFTADQLRRADPTVPKDIATQDLQLPDGLSPTVAATAHTVTDTAPTAYDKAIALQTWFREPDQGGFTYDQTVQAGHSDSAILDFLRIRRGFCEQFAGTFAAMARAIGLPARVAVGFTPGINQDGDQQLFVVKGEHAHAWPEVYLGEYGWVAFEPTPGRGAPNAGYTNVTERQADDATSPSTTTTTSPNATTTTSPADEANARDAAAGLTNLDTPGSRGGGPSSSPWPGRALLAGEILLGLGVAYLVGVPAAVALRQRRRRARASGADGRVAVAWTESQESLELTGALRRRDETNQEFAARAGDRLPDRRAALATLAGSTDAAVFGAAQVDEAQAEAAERTADEVRSSVRLVVPRWRRLVHAADVRRLLPSRPARRRLATRRA